MKMYDTCLNDGQLLSVQHLVNTCTELLRKLLAFTKTTQWKIYDIGLRRNAYVDYIEMNLGNVQELDAMRLNGNSAL